MEPDHRKKISDRIELEIRDSTARIEALEETVEPKESDCGIGRILNPDNVPGQAAAMETLRIERQRISRLQAARARLHDPDFGTCRACGNPIPLDRLLLVPETQVCATCKPSR